VPAAADQENGGQEEGRERIEHEPQWAEGQGRGYHRGVRGRSGDQGLDGRPQAAGCTGVSMMTAELIERLGLVLQRALSERNRGWQRRLRRRKGEPIN